MKTEGGVLQKVFGKRILRLIRQTHLADDVRHLVFDNLKELYPRSEEYKSLLRYFIHKYQTISVQEESELGINVANAFRDRMVQEKEMLKCF